MSTSSLIDTKNIIKNLPSDPGVYRFYASDDSLLYIGKAKNLKKRVTSYFQDSRGHNERIALMISQINRVEYTVVKTEKDALILESNLIYALQPRYNVALKDNNDYLYVRLTTGQVPTFTTVRRKYDPKSRYFGPFTKKFAIDNVLRTLRMIFPYCQDARLGTESSRPCAYVSLHQCEGICCGKESLEDYLVRVEQVCKVLSGHTGSAENWIRERIMQAVEWQNYELAALWRDRLALLKETVHDQKIILPQPQDLDIVTLIVQPDPSSGFNIGSVFVQNIREGKIVNVNNFLLSGSEGQDTEESTEKTADAGSQEIVQSFLNRFFTAYSANRQDEGVAVLLQSYVIEDETPPDFLESK
jgi:excinuclease ABC subunit C